MHFGILPTSVRSGVTQDRVLTTQNRAGKPAEEATKLTWRWILVALILIAVVSTSVVLLREQLDRFAKFGYLGAFLISFLASATVIAFMPSVPVIFALGGALNPFYVGLGGRCR